MQIVAVDLEGTLTAGETWRGLAAWLKANGYGRRYRWFLFTHLPYYLAMRAGWMDRTSFNVRWVRGLLRAFRGFTLTQFEQAAEWAVEAETWPKRRPALVQELWAHREAGRKIMLVSGAYQPIVEAVGRRVGADIALGTALEAKSEVLTGRFAEAVNVGPVKVQRLAAYLEGGKLLAAYGDTIADQFMLESSENPTAVCPDGGLRQVASERSWRILEDDCQKV
jgi:phosphoserine phosphatase